MIFYIIDTLSVNSLLKWYLLMVFLNQSSFSFFIHSDKIASSSYCWDNLSWINVNLNFFFKFATFLIDALNESRSWGLPPVLAIYFLVFSHILLQNYFVSFESSCSFVLVFSSLTWNNFLSLFRMIRFCLYYLTFSRNLMSFPSIANIFSFISSSCLSDLSAVVFFGHFILLCALVYVPFFNTFGCFNSFFICHSNLILLPAFWFLFYFFIGIPIFIND